MNVVSEMTALALAQPRTGAGTEATAAWYLAKAARHAVLARHARDRSAALRRGSNA